MIKNKDVKARKWLRASVRSLLICLLAGGLSVFTGTSGTLAAGGVTFRPQVRQMDPKLKQLIERERFLKRGYVKKEGKWVKAQSAPSTTRLVKELTGSAGKRLKLHMIDVGQGDAMLIQTPNGKNILVDAGFGPTDWSNFDAGKKRILPYLEYLGVKKLDAIVVSHPHNDHDGGVSSVLRGMEVGELLDSGHNHTAAHYYKVLEAVKKKGLKYRQVKAGDKLDFDPQVKMEVLNPPGPNAYRGTNSDTNNSSVVLRITYGDVSMLLTGDAEEDAEQKMVRNRYDVKSNVLKVAHHGSKTSTIERFLSRVMPEVALISCGLNNRYGHPKDEILRRLKRKRAKIYRTDFDSTVVVETDGKFFAVEAFGEIPPEHKNSIIGDTENKKFYLPGSKYYVRVYPGRRRYFKTEAEARSAGFEKSYY